MNFVLIPYLNSSVFRFLQKEIPRIDHKRGITWIPCLHLGLLMKKGGGGKKLRYILFITSSFIMPHQAVLSSYSCKCVEVL